MDGAEEAAAAAAEAVASRNARYMSLIASKTCPTFATGSPPFEIGSVIFCKSYNIIIIITLVILISKIILYVYNILVK